MFALYGLKLFHLNLLSSRTEAFRHFESMLLGDEHTSEMMLLKRDLYSTESVYGQMKFDKLFGFHAREAEISILQTFLNKRKFHRFIYIINPTPHDCVRFEQFVWLQERFYTSINSVSKNLGTIFLPPALKTHNYFDKNEMLMTKLEL